MYSIFMISNYWLDTINCNEVTAIYVFSYLSIVLNNFKYEIKIFLSFIEFIIKNKYLLFNNKYLSIFVR